MRLHWISLETIEVSQGALKFSSGWMRESSVALLASSDWGHDGICLVVKRDVLWNFVAEHVGVLSSGFSHSADQLKIKN